MDTGRAPTAVAPDATVEQVQDAAARTDHMRILLVETGQPEVVHVRDTLLAPADAPARPLARSAMPLEKDTPVYEALSLARSSSEQLMVVMDGEEFLGVITVSDILRKILPEPRPAGASAE